MIGLSPAPVPGQAALLTTVKSKYVVVLVINYPRRRAMAASIPYLKQRKCGIDIARSLS